MKRYSTLLLVFGAITLVSFYMSTAVHADDTSIPMTEAHITRIRNSCVQAQSSLTQLHATDALLRVNRGQIYESISTKLMEPLNSRAAINSLDATQLVSVATLYDQQLTAFRNDYQQYEQTMSKTLKIDCKNQPVEFYDSVTDTRNKRVTVHNDTVNLQTTIQSYKTAFEVFATPFEGATK
jgi:hypothetical protein